MWKRSNDVSICYCINFIIGFLSLHDLLDELNGEYMNVASSSEIMWACNP